MIGTPAQSLAATSRIQPYTTPVPGTGTVIQQSAKSSARMGLNQPLNSHTIRRSANLGSASTSLIQNPATPLVGIVSFNLLFLPFTLYPLPFSLNMPPGSWLTSGDRRESTPGVRLPLAARQKVDVHPGVFEAARPSLPRCQASLYRAPPFTGQRIRSSP